MGKCRMPTPVGARFGLQYFARATKKCRVNIHVNDAIVADWMHSLFWHCLRLCELAYYL